LTSADSVRPLLHSRTSCTLIPRFDAIVCSLSPVRTVYGRSSACVRVPRWGRAGRTHRADRGRRAPATRERAPRDAAEAEAERDIISLAKVLDNLNAVPTRTA
jgi:hypothetical protein